MHFQAAICLVKNQSYIELQILTNFDGTQHKWHLTKTTSHKNGISELLLLVFSSITNTLLIKPTPKIRHKLEKLDFKIP